MADDANQVEEVTQAQETHEQLEQEDAAIMAAISEARGDTPSESPAQTPAVTTEAEPPAEEAPAPELASLTTDQFNTLLTKANEVDELKAQMRNVFGKFGEMKDRILELQKPGHTEQAAETVGELKDIAAKYHEAILDGDMERANELFMQSLRVGRAPVGQPSGATDERLTEAMTQQDKKFEGKLIRMVHKDFDKITKSQDFGAWVKTLPPQEQTTLVNSWDAQYVSGKVDEFKEWREKQAKNAEQRQQQQQNSQRRLSNAVTPQGSATAAPIPVSEEEAMQAQIRARRRQFMAAT